MDRLKILSINNIAVDLDQLGNTEIASHEFNRILINRIKNFINVLTAEININKSRGTLCQLMNTMNYINAPNRPGVIDIDEFKYTIDSEIHNFIVSEVLSIINYVIRRFDITIMDPESFNNDIDDSLIETMEMYIHEDELALIYSLLGIESLTYGESHDIINLTSGLARYYSDAYSITAIPYMRDTLGEFLQLIKEHPAQYEYQSECGEYRLALDIYTPLFYLAILELTQERWCCK